MKKLGKLQAELLSVMSQELEDGYWYSMRDLIEITGKLQQSIHRSLRSLLNNSLVIERSDKCDTLGGLPKQYKLYMLKCKKDLQSDIDKMRSDESNAIKKEALSLGISESEHRFNKFFKFK